MELCVQVVDVNFHHIDYIRTPVWNGRQSQAHAITFRMHFRCNSLLSASKLKALRKNRDLVNEVFGRAISFIREMTDEQVVETCAHLTRRYEMANVEHNSPGTNDVSFSVICSPNRGLEGDYDLTFSSWFNDIEGPLETREDLIRYFESGFTNRDAITAY